MYSFRPFTAYHINAKTITPPNIVDAQFILEAVTGLAKGQNEKNHKGVVKHKAPTLTASPNRPSDHRLGGKGAPYNLLHTRQPIVTKYDVRTETPPSELMAFNAVVDPRLMQASKDVTASDTNTDRTGRFQPGGTTDSHADPGRPESRAKDHSWREAVATSLMQQAQSMKTTIAVMTFAAPWLRVPL